MSMRMEFSRTGPGFYDGAVFSDQAAEEEIILTGTDAGVIGIGNGMKEGRITVEGDVGAEAGKGMAGGVLTIRGNAGKSALCGMQDGLAVFCGDVQSGFGADMRRGIAVVYGKAYGDVLADMMGGTVLLIGGLGEGARLCEGMNRGTVVVPSSDFVPAGFCRAADVDLTFLRFLFTELKKQGIDVPEDWYGRPFARWRGDEAALGKGEILVPEGK